VTWNSTAHSICIGADQYEGIHSTDGDGETDATMWVAGFDLESLPQSQNTGIPVQGGGMVQINLKNVGTPKRAYVSCHFDAVLELKSQGAIAYS
jgi:hypothetical protein